MLSSTTTPQALRRLVVGALQERSVGRRQGGGGDRRLHRSEPGSRGVCEDPKDYRYCDYAEAIATDSATALEGMRTILNMPQSAGPEEVKGNIANACI